MNSEDTACRIVIFDNAGRTEGNRGIAQEFIETSDRYLCRLPARGMLENRINALFTHNNPAHAERVNQSARSPFCDPDSTAIVPASSWPAKSYS